MAIEWLPAFVAYPPGPEKLEIAVTSASGSGQWYFYAIDLSGNKVLDCSDLVETEEEAKRLAAVWYDAHQQLRWKEQMQGPGVYFVKSVSGHTKIGRSRNIADRIKTFGVKLPFEVKIFHFISTSRCIELEKYFHSRYRDNRINGEWFELSDDELAWIKQQQEVEALLDHKTCDTLGLSSTDQIR